MGWGKKSRLVAVLKVTGECAVCGHYGECFHVDKDFRRYVCSECVDCVVVAEKELFGMRFLPPSDEMIQGGPEASY